MYRLEKATGSKKRSTNTEYATIGAGPDINHYRRVEGRVQGPTCDRRLGLNARSLGNQRANTSRNPASTNGLGR